MPRPGIPIAVVVFDFDGTLVDSNRVKDETFMEVAASLPGGPEAMAAVRTAPGLDRHQVFDRFAARLGLRTAESAAVADDFSRLVDRRVAEAPAIHGAMDLLDALADAGIPCHLSSATPLIALSAIVERRGWTRRFASLHGRPDDKFSTLSGIADRHRIADPAAIAVVGDGLDDLESARRMGCRFFAVGDRPELAALTPLSSLETVRRRLLTPELPNHD